MTEKVVLPYINKLIISGRLTRDAELRWTSDNTGILSFRIASTKRYMDKNREWKENQLFINVTHFSKYADKISDRMKTGVPVIIEGSIELNTYENKTTHEKVSNIQIRADKINFISRQAEDGERSGYQANDLGSKVKEIDKNFDELLDNENIGGEDDLPF